MSDSSYDLAPQDPAPKIDAPQSLEHKPDSPPSTKTSVPAIHAAPERLCPRCGFKITGKTRRFRCPACSAPLDASVADLLQFSTPAWVRFIAWGPLLMAVGILMHLTAVAMTFKISSASGIGALNLIAGMMISGGTWIITTPEPRGTPHRRRSMGNSARWTMLAVCALWLLAVLLMMTQYAPSNLVSDENENSVRGVVIKGARHLTISGWLMMITLIALAFAAVCIGSFLNALGERIPNEGLAVQFLNFSWIMPVAVSVVIAFQLFNGPDYFQLLFFFTFPLAGGLMGIMLWAAVSLVRLTLGLHGAAAAGDFAAAKLLRQTASKI